MKGKNAMKGKVVPGYQVVDIKKLVPSKSNYRKTFDKAAMAELTASIKAKGVLQPILVRPVNGHLEIVAGHRRHQGALGAGLKEMPVIVRDLSDTEALEIQVVENTQREDPNPMEEGWGFKALLEKGQHTPETLAGKIDKSARYVLERVKLTTLLEEAQKKIASGGISLGHALLLTRLRQPGEQKDFLGKMLKTGISIKGAKDQLAEMYASHLDEAVFDKAKCADCHFNSRNQGALFPEVNNHKQSECTDRGCFNAKTREHYMAILNEVKEQGFRVITGDLAQQYCWGKGTRIAAPGDKSYKEVPKKYKTECLKCTENHVYFLYESEKWSGRIKFEMGEVCTNKNCLNKMQGRKEVPASLGRDNAGNAVQKAEFCRDRFLKKRIPFQVDGSNTLQLRTLIYHLIDKLDRTQARLDILKELGLKKSPEYGYIAPETLYGYIMALPEGELALWLKKLIKVTLVENTPAKVLLYMSKEAGIDFGREVLIDEAYLNTKTKDELCGLARTFDMGPRLGMGPVGTGIGNLPEKFMSAKKSEMIKAILAQDLTGKMTPELRKVLAIKG